MMRKLRQSYLRRTLIRSETLLQQVISEVIRSVRNIKAAPMKQHGHSVTLRTLLCELRGSCCQQLSFYYRDLRCSALTVATILKALLTGKTKLILPPSGKFQRESFKRRWRRVQHNYC